MRVVPSNGSVVIEAPAPRSQQVSPSSSRPRINHGGAGCSNSSIRPGGTKRPSARWSRCVSAGAWTSAISRTPYSRSGSRARRNLSTSRLVAACTHPGRAGTSVTRMRTAAAGRRGPAALGRSPERWPGSLRTALSARRASGSAILRKARISRGSVWRLRDTQCWRSSIRRRSIPVRFGCIRSDQSGTVGAGRKDAAARVHRELFARVQDVQIAHLQLPHPVLWRERLGVDPFHR